MGIGRQAGNGAPGLAGIDREHLVAALGKIERDAMAGAIGLRAGADHGDAPHGTEPIGEEGVVIGIVIHRRT